MIDLKDILFMSNQLTIVKIHKENMIPVLIVTIIWAFLKTFR